MKIHFYILSIFLISISCENQIENKTEITTVQNTDSTNRMLSELIESQGNSIIEVPLDISEINTSGNIGFTSSGPYNKSQVDSCFIAENRFFGRYHLIDKRLIGREARFGDIDIYEDAESRIWRATDSNQIIEQIHLTSNAISVWDSIHVGITREKVMQFCFENNGLGIRKGEYYYSCSFKNYGVVFSLINDTVTELRITRNCRNKN